MCVNRWKWGRLQYCGGGGGGEGGMEVKTNIMKAGNVLFNNAL